MVISRQERVQALQTLQCHPHCTAETKHAETKKGSADSLTTKFAVEPRLQQHFAIYFLNVCTPHATPQTKCMDLLLEGAVCQPLAEAASTFRSATEQIPGLK